MPDCSTCYSYIGWNYDKWGKCRSGFTSEECQGSRWRPYYKCMGGLVFDYIPKKFGYVLLEPCIEHCLKYYSPCPRVGILSGRFKLKDWLPHLTEADKKFLGIHTEGAIQVLKRNKNQTAVKEAMTEVQTEVRVFFDCENFKCGYFNKFCRHPESNDPKFFDDRYMAGLNPETGRPICFKEKVNGEEVAKAVDLFVNGPGPSPEELNEARAKFKNDLDRLFGRSDEMPTVETLEDPDNGVDSTPAHMEPTEEELEQYGQQDVARQESDSGLCGKCSLFLYPDDCNHPDPDYPNCFTPVTVIETPDQVDLSPRQWPASCKVCNLDSCDGCPNASMPQGTPVAIPNPVKEAPTKCPYLVTIEGHSGDGRNLPRAVINCFGNYTTYYDPASFAKVQQCNGDFRECEIFKELELAINNEANQKLEPEPVKETPAWVQDTGFSTVSIGLLYPNPANPRKRFDQESLDKLTESIRQVGILEPLLVVRDGDRYRIVAGERRYRAALAAGLKEVPVIVRELTEQQEFEIVLTENLQRQDLDPIEEAQAFATAVARGWKQTELASKLGISQELISNRMRLLKLPETVQESISRGILSAGHGLALVKVAGAPKYAEQLAKRLIDENIPVAKAAERVESRVAWDGKKLYRDPCYDPEPILFNPDKFCGKCPNRVEAGHTEGGKKHPYCLDEKCWEKHQDEARLEKAEALKKKLEKQVGGQDAVIDIRKLNYDQRRTFDHEKISPDDCGACEFLKAGVGYSNEAVAVCLKPSCFEDKKKKAESLAQREFRREQKDFEKVKDELVARGLFEPAPNGTRAYRRNVLEYMVAIAIDQGPCSSKWTRSKIQDEICRRMGWTLDKNGYENRQADLVKYIQTLDIDNLFTLLVFALIKPAEHTSKIYQLTLGAAAGASEEVSVG